MAVAVSVALNVEVGEAHLPVPSISTHIVGVGEAHWPVPVVSTQGVEVGVAVSQWPGSQVGVEVAVSQPTPVAGLQMGVGVGVLHTTPGWQVGVAVSLLPFGTTQPVVGRADTLLAGPVIPATAAAVLSMAPSSTRASTITWKARFVFRWVDSLLSISHPSFVQPVGEGVPRHSAPITNSARMRGHEEGSTRR